MTYAAHFLVRNTAHCCPVIQTMPVNSKKISLEPFANLQTSALDAPKEMKTLASTSSQAGAVMNFAKDSSVMQLFFVLQHSVLYLLA